MSTYAERSYFERERERVVADLAENLARCVTNVNQLNRNIENAALLGTSFENLYGLWSQFRNVMENPQGGDEPQATALAQDRPAEADLALPPGVAPGGGETMLASQ